ncbi:hypothetical protein ABPG72_017012 [Tetrahymena utriculariae]
MPACFYLTKEKGEREKQFYFVLYFSRSGEKIFYRYSGIYNMLILFGLNRLLPNIWFPVNFLIEITKANNNYTNINTYSSFIIFSYSALFNGFIIYIIKS